MDGSQWEGKDILQEGAVGGWGQEVPRYVGNAHNRLLAGVLLHQQRSPPRVLPAMCRGGAQGERFLDLTSMCTAMELMSASQTGAEAALQAEELADPLAPYGTDPVLRPASRLFNPAALPEDFYNTSAAAEEVSGSGAARWFFPRRMAGFADGFPLVLETRLSRRRASEVWHGLDESALIDDKTESLSARFAVFNAKALALGVGKMTFLRTRSGLLSSVLEIQEVNATPTFSGHAKLYIAEVAIAGMLCYLKLKGLRAARGAAFKLALIACLIAVQGVHLLVILRGAGLEVQPSYDIYDAAHSAAARWWMPFKTDEQDAADEPSFVPRGAPGRWTLPDDNSGLDAFGAALMDIDELVLANTLWHFLQLVALAMLLVHWLQLASVSPSIERIRNTIASARSDLGHFFVLMAILMLLAAFSGHIVLGGELQSMASLPRAVESIFSLMVSSDLGGINQLAKSTEVELSTAESLAAHMLLFLLPTLFVFIMLNFLLAILGLRWAEQLEVRDLKLRAQQYQSQYGHPVADVLVSATGGMASVARSWASGAGMALQRMLPQARDARVPTAPGPTARASDEGQKHRRREGGGQSPPYVYEQGGWATSASLTLGDQDGGASFTPPLPRQCSAAAKRRPSDRTLHRTAAFVVHAARVKARERELRRQAAVARAADAFMAGLRRRRGGALHEERQAAGYQALRGLLQRVRTRGEGSLSLARNDTQGGQTAEGRSAADEEHLMAALAVLQLHAANEGPKLNGPKLKPAWDSGPCAARGEIQAWTTQSQPFPGRPGGRAEEEPRGPGSQCLQPTLMSMRRVRLAVEAVSGRLAVMAGEQAAAAAELGRMMAALPCRLADQNIELGDKGDNGGRRGSSRPASAELLPPGTMRVGDIDLRLHILSEQSRASAAVVASLPEIPSVTPPKTPPDSGLELPGAVFIVRSSPKAASLPGTDPMGSPREQQDVAAFMATEARAARRREKAERMACISATLPELHSSDGDKAPASDADASTPPWAYPAKAAQRPR